jgi:hypothetical protein
MTNHHQTLREQFLEAREDGPENKIEVLALFGLLMQSDEGVGDLDLPAWATLTSEEADEIRDWAIEAQANLAFEDDPWVFNDKEATVYEWLAALEAAGYEGF